MESEYAVPHIFKKISTFYGSKRFVVVFSELATAL
jgi:hypothetical protein